MGQIIILKKENDFYDNLLCLKHQIIASECEEYFVSAFSNAVLDGCIVVFEAMYIARMLK